MRDLPTGTVTFLFTDVEGSTRLLHERGIGTPNVTFESGRAAGGSLSLEEAAASVCNLDSP